VGSASSFFVCWSGLYYLFKEDFRAENHKGLHFDFRIGFQIGYELPDSMVKKDYQYKIIYYIILILFFFISIYIFFLVTLVTS